MKIIIVVDVSGGGAGTSAMKDGELKPVCYCLFAIASRGKYVD